MSPSAVNDVFSVTFFCCHVQTVTSGGPLGSKFFQFHATFGKNLAKIVCWRPPGSAIGNIANHATHFKGCVDDTITMHSSSMYTACSSLYRGVSVQVVFVQGFSVWGSLSGRPPYGNEQAVRILLECILVQTANCY